MTERPWSERIPVAPRAVTTIADLRARFPLWRIWESDLGRVWASTSGHLTTAQQAAGGRVTVNADTPDDMWDALLEQEKIWGRS